MTRADMFHVPFSARRKVGPQRFSIPGLPCLYLGSSTYICWEELDRPSLDSLCFSKVCLRAGEKINIVNLSTTASQISTWLKLYYDPTQTEATSYQTVVAAAVSRAICWPLVAACSIKVLDKQAPFKPEYIISQLLLQHVTSSRSYDGIMYRSTMVGVEIAPDEKCVNLVFPCRDFSKPDYCEYLRSKFELTKPISWRLAQLSNAPIIITDKLRREPISLIPDQITYYELTQFGEFEKRIEAGRCLDSST
jgi:hypothetical protein